MEILTFLYPLNAFLMITLPFFLAVFLKRRLRANWRWWLIGAAVFFLSQIGHLAFNAALLPPLRAWLDTAALLPDVSLALYALFLGLSAGLWEELARYFMFLWWARDARSWRAAVITGAGHGGMESFLLGVLTLWTFGQMMALRGADLASTVSAERLPYVQAQFDAYWSAAGGQVFLGTLERVFAMCLHIAFAVLVWQVFRRRQWRWLWLAIAFHAFLDAATVFLLQKIGLWVEAVIALMAAFALWIIFRLREDEPSSPAAAGTFAPLTLEPVPVDVADLESSKYQS